MVIMADTGLAAHAAKQVTDTTVTMETSTTIDPERLTTPEMAASALAVARLLQPLAAEASRQGGHNRGYVHVSNLVVATYLAAHDINSSVLADGLVYLEEAGFVEVVEDEDVLILKPTVGWHQDGAVERLGVRLAELVLEAGAPQ